MKDSAHIQLQYIAPHSSFDTSSKSAVCTNFRFGSRMTAYAPCRPTIIQPVTTDDDHLVKVIPHVCQLPSERILGGRHDAVYVLIELSRSHTPFLCVTSCIERKGLCSLSAVLCPLSAVRCGLCRRAARALICRGMDHASQHTSVDGTPHNEEAGERISTAGMGASRQHTSTNTVLPSA